jgi:retron-type reverse transcriptase
VETAAVLVLEPIFEADLQPEQYAYRQGRSALDAVMHVHKLVNTGYREIVDADLSGYFDSIPHV